MILHTQRGRGTKIHLLLDGEYRLTTDAEFWYSHFIADGTELSDEAWDALEQQLTCRRAYQKALDFLSRRDHSHLELMQKLMRTFDREAAKSAIQRLDELGYLDDEKYARTLASYLLEHKNFSVGRVKRELAQRGIDRDSIDLVLAETETDPVAQVLSLLHGKYAAKLANEKDRRRTVNALQRLGYSYSEIRTALSRYETELTTYEE